MELWSKMEHHRLFITSLSRCWLPSFAVYGRSIGLEPNDPVFQTLQRFSRTEHRLIGLRAEQMIVGRERVDARPRIDFVVERIEFLGSYCLVRGTVGSRPMEESTMAENAKAVGMTIDVSNT